jgi:uncharacterized protein (TIGR03066 family)
VVLFLTACGSNSDKGGTNDYADKLVGRWEKVKVGRGLGATFEFKKDGQMSYTLKGLPKEMTQAGTYTYTVEGDVIHMTHKFAGEESTQRLTIKSLTDDKLVIENDEGKIEEFKKK